MMQAALDFTREYPPHQRHSDTSRASAAATAPRFSERLISVLQVICAQHEYGATDEEGQALTGMEGNSYRPVRVTLVAHGLVSDSGKRRKTKSGRSAAVWSITKAGYLKLEEVSYGQ